MRRDVAQVLASAKQQMLTLGEHAPLVFVSTRRERHCLPVKDGWNDDHSSRTKALFLLGRAFAQEAHITAEMISTVSLVAEVWTVERRAGDPELQAPVEEQPDHRECLSLLELRREGKKLRQTMYLVDILRQGGVIDLGPTRKMREIDSTLLASFFAGVGSARWTDRQLLERLTNGQDVGGL